MGYDVAVNSGEALPAAPKAEGRSPSGNVAQRLLDFILHGNLEPGDRLPAERTLSVTLSVGRSAVREAISALELLGIVETVGGSGTYLRAATSELLPSALNWGMMLGQEQTANLHQVRAFLEVAAVEQATLRYTQEGLAELESILIEQHASLGDPEHFVETDSAFHRHIATTAGNPILEDLLSTSRSLLRLWVERSVHDRSDMENAIREHDTVLAALKNGETINAAAAMRLHMMTAHARLLAAAAQPNDD